LARRRESRRTFENRSASVNVGENHDHVAIFTCHRSHGGTCFFGFYSPDLQGFTGIGHSIEDCLYKARWGMADHEQMMRKQGLPVPAHNPDPTIVIQNQPKLEPA